MSKKELSEDLQEKLLKLGEDFAALEEPISLIIRFHLHLEYFMNKALEQTFTNSSILKERDYTFHLKLMTLGGLGILNEDEVNNAKIINNIRNSFAHNLEVNEEVIKDKSRNLKSDANGAIHRSHTDEAKIMAATIQLIKKLKRYCEKSEHDRKKSS